MISATAVAVKTATGYNRGTVAFQFELTANSQISGGAGGGWQNAASAVAPMGGIGAQQQHHQCPQCGFHF